MTTPYANLNEEQREAVLHDKGPALILAGAGSGKTRVVTFRITRLIQEKKVPPSRIMAVTFTNKAAQEMRGRIAGLVGRSGAQGIFMGTFHSFCLQMLKIHGEKLGYRAGFTIYDDSDQKSLIKECLWDLKWDEKEIKPQVIHSYISTAKNDLKNPKEYAEQVEEDFTEKKAQAAQVYPRYQAKLKQNNAMDFDDLLFNAVLLLKQYPEVLESYRQRFDYVMVDEYQDINSAQYQLISAITHPLNNLYVVGDPDQSIYGWRGADIRNILRFEHDFPGARVFKLQQNYRSTKSVIQAAQAVIRNNSQRKEKELFSLRETGEAITYYQAEDAEDEARFVVTTLYQRLGEPGRKYRHVAILYRTNAQSRVLEDACRRNNIPYVIVGGLKFYDRKEVKDLLAYLHVLVNPQDSVSLRRMINIPIRGIGSGTVEKLEQNAKQQDLSMLDAARQAALGDEFGKKITQALAAFVAMMDELTTQKALLNPSKFVRAVLERSGYLTELTNEDTPESKMRAENLKELVNSVADYEENIMRANAGVPDEEAVVPTLEGYLDQVSLVADVDKLDDDKNSVTLMTMHNAKGLEFPIIFLTGMEEGLFPHNNSIESDENSQSDEKVQEERRLCYVGMTRAMDLLYLTGASSRKVYGTLQWRAPSRFLLEIPKDMLQTTGKAATVTATQWGLYPIANSKKEFDELKDPEWDEEGVMPFHPGDTVWHKAFGKGVVLALSGSGDNVKVMVSFPNHGKKNLVAKMANLEKIE